MSLTYLPLAIAALLVSSTDVFAAEACPYALVRYRSDSGDRVLLVPEGNLSPKPKNNSGATVDGIDITLLIEDMTGQGAAAARKEAYLSPNRQKQLAAWACEFRDPEAALRKYPSVAVRSVQAWETVALEWSNHVVHARRTGEELPKGISILIRNPVSMGTEITSANLSDVIAGVVLNRHFIPVEMLEEVARKMELPAISPLSLGMTLTVLLRQRELAERGLRPYDLVQVYE